jgi:hypothetical protein
VTFTFKGIIAAQSEPAKMPTGIFKGQIKVTEVPPNNWQLRTKQPTCCRHSGTLWDLVALYPNGTSWEESEPFYIDGPVYKVESELESQTSKLLQSVNAINAASANPIR